MKFASGVNNYLSVVILGIPLQFTVLVVLLVNNLSKGRFHDRRLARELRRLRETIVSQLNIHS